MSRLTRVLLSQYSKAVKDPNPNPNLSVFMDLNNVKLWYFLVKGLEDPYTDGEYIFSLLAPKDFPTKPPRLEFLTNNGLFQTGVAICTSIGEYHANNAPGKEGSYGWRPALGMIGFATQVVNGMICHNELRGVGILVTSDQVKRDFAAISKEYNEENYADLSSRFITL